MNYYLNKINNDLSLFDEESSILSTFFNTVNKETKVMRTDILENEKEFILNMEVPGFNKENIKISLEQKYLTIDINKEIKKEGKTEYLLKERYEGKFSRTFYVGNVDKANIKAKVEDGILTITLPKQELKQEKTQIEIN